MIRILYQGFLHPAEHHEFLDRQQAYLTGIADPGTAFTYVGMSTPDVAIHRLTETRCGTQAVRNAIQAADRGFDAVILGHFQDTGLWEIRSSVDVPVIGLGENALLAACTIGARIGVVGIDPLFVPWHREQVARYELGSKVVGINAMTAPVRHFMDAFAGGAAYADILEQFRAKAREHVVAGAEVIVPAGGLPALLFSGLRGFTVDGAPVLPVTALAAKAAEAAVRVQRLTGLTASRVAKFAMPSDRARAEYLEFVPDHSASMT